MLFDFEMADPKYCVHNLDDLQADLSFVFVCRAGTHGGRPSWPRQPQLFVTE